MIGTLEKGRWLMQFNSGLSGLSRESEPEIRMMSAFEIEVDKQQSYIGSKANRRSLEYAVDHAPSTVTGLRI